MRRMLAEHLGDVRGRNILLKPNLVEFEPESSINTHPMLVHAAYEAFRAMGAASVRIAEGPGHRRNTLDLADAAGYFHTVPDFEDHFIDLNLDEVTRVQPDAPVLAHQKALPAQQRAGRRPAGLHGQDEDASLGGRDAFDEESVRRGARAASTAGRRTCCTGRASTNRIADLHAAFPHHFAIVDGIVGMEGNGPIQGTPKPAGVLVAGATRWRWTPRAAAS